MSREDDKERAVDHAVGSDAFWYGVVERLGALSRRILTEKVKEPLWQSFDGRVFTPAQMSDTHLHNVIALCQRRHDAGEEYGPSFAALLTEYQRRGIAQSERERVQTRVRKQENLERLKEAQHASELRYDPAHHCIVCGFTPKPGQKSQLKPWMPDRLDTLRCTDAKSCQSHIINAKITKGEIAP